MKLGSKSRALTMLLIGTLLGAIMLSPVVAGPNDPATKKFARKVANKKATKKAKAVENKLQPQIDDRHTKAQANSMFQGKSELLFARVNNAGMAGGATPATLMSGRGVTDVTGFVGTVVTFNRNIENCIWNATYERTGSNEEWFTQVQLNSATSVTVWLSDGTGILNSGNGEKFHLIVICP